MHRDRDNIIASWASIRRVERVLIIISDTDSTTKVVGNEAVISGTVGIGVGVVVKKR